MALGQGFAFQVLCLHSFIDVYLGVFLMVVHDIQPFFLKVALSLGSLALLFDPGPYAYGQYVPMVALESGAGFIIPHSNSIAAISSYRPVSVQLSASKLLTGRASWETCFCTPAVGVIGFYHNYRNSELLGTGIGTMAFVQPMFGIKNRFSYGFRMGGGPVYLNQVFDPVSNPENLFFSSPVSAVLQAGFELRYSFLPAWSAYLMAVYNHISNGGLREPNKGMNYPTLMLGLSTYLEASPSWPDYEKSREWKNERPFSFSVSALYTARASGDLYSRRLHVYGLDVAGHWRHGKMGEARGGIEWAADTKRSETARQAGETLSPHHAGLHMGEYLVAGRFGLGIAIGAYFWNAPPYSDPIYQRYQLSCDVHRNLRLSITLRAHRSVADFADLRVGVIF